MASSPHDDERAAERQRDAALRFISHDMRSPQSSILSLLELYDRSPPDKRDTARLHERIRGYARLALDLSEDFLMIARAEAGGIDLQVHDLHGLLDEAADTVWSRARARQIRIVLPEPQDEADCRLDRALVTRALSLLLAGAVEGAADGAEIRCDIVPAGPDGAWWQVSLQAPAPGWADDLGAALKFARAAAQAHGGTVAVAGDLPPGTGLVVCLPRDAKRADFATNHEQPLPV